jgi:hypothetical protein
LAKELSEEARAMRGAIDYFNNQIAEGPEEIKLFDDSGFSKRQMVNKQVITERLNVNDIVNLFCAFFGEEFSSNYIARKVVETYYEGRNHVDFVVYRRVLDKKIIGLFIKEWLYYGETRFLPYHMKLTEVIAKMVKKRNT